MRVRKEYSPRRFPAILSSAKRIESSQNAGLSRVGGAELNWSESTILIEH